MKIAVYPGTFDPITNGHMDVLKRGLEIFDKIIIAVIAKPAKQTLFTAKERVEMAKAATHGMDVSVEDFDSLLVEFMKKKNVNFVLRGLRAVSDFEHEFQMAVANKDIDNKIETVFVMTDKKYLYLSSTMVKEVARYKGPLGNIVPKNVEAELRKKFK